jgi:hypothetical protein
LREFLASTGSGYSDAPAEPVAPAEPQMSVEALPDAAPEPDAFEQYLSSSQPQQRPSSYEAPPEVQKGDNKWLWIASALDLALNQGKSLPTYVSQMAAPDNSAHENWNRRNKAMNDASSRDAQAAQAERARMAPRGKVEDPHTLAMRDPRSPETEQWRTAAVAAGIVTPEVAAKMSGEQLVALRPQLGQQVSQEKGFQNATAGRNQSHSLAVRRQALANEFANDRITYQDYLLQQRAIDEGDAKAETAAATTAPDSPAVVQDHSEKYGQEIRLRGVDGTEAALAKVEQMLAQYPEGDIPGYGPIDGLKPDAMLGEEARAMRAAVMELQDSKLREATGAAAPPSEAKTFGEILGTGLFAGEGDLRRGVAQARQKVDEQKGYVAEMYPSARQAGGAARPQQRKQRVARPRPAEGMNQPAVTPGKELTEDEWNELQDLGGDF